MFEEFFANGGLSFERLNTLLKLSEAGSLIKAAKNEHWPAKPLESSLARIIRNFSAWNFTGESRKINRELTPAGKSLVQLAREHFLELQAFRNQTAKIIPTLRNCRRRQHYPITLGASNQAYTGDPATQYCCFNH